MRPPDRAVGVRQPPGFTFYFLVGIIVVLCAQAISYVLLMDSTIGRFSLFGGQKAPDPALAREIKIVLLRSQLTAKLYPENPEPYFARERHWEKVLSRAGLPLQVITEAELDKGLGDATVLVLPGVACLGEPERKAIFDFLEQGKGVVASGAVGTRDAACDWRGGEFLSRLVGAGQVAAATPVENTYVTFRGQQYYSPKIPTGYLLSLPSQEVTLVSASEPDAYWTDQRFRPAQGDSFSAVGLAIHGNRAEGRFVWFGFSEMLPVERKADQLVLDSYLEEGVLWAGKQVMAALGNWPERKQAAVLVAQNAQGDMGNAAATVQLLRQQGVPSIVFCDAGEAARNPQAVKNLLAAGEVGASGDKQEAFSGQTAREQAQRLIEAKQAVEKATGEKVAGFDPPHGLSDVGTVIALNDAGYQYYLNASTVTQAVPEGVEFTQSALFPLQKIVVSKVLQPSADDFEVLANAGGASGEGADVAEGFLRDFRRLFYLGGVYTLHFHSYLLGAPEYRSTLQRVVQAIKSQPVWITTGKELVDYWTARRKVQVQATKISPHRIRVDVANLGDDDLKNQSVYVYLPYRPQKVELRSSLFHLQLPRHEMMERDQILRIDFSELSGQTNYSFLVVMDE